jgi:hypothetical protein
VASLRDKGGNAPELNFEKVLSKPDCTIINSEEAAHRISTLWAAQEIAQLSTSDPASAVSLGTAYRVVSSVTGAVVLETEGDYKATNLHRNRYQRLAYASANSASSAPIAKLDLDRNAPGPAAFGSTGAGGTGNSAHTANSEPSTADDVSAESATSASMLQGASTGFDASVRPSSASQSDVAQVNTAGTVRVNNLSGVEGFLSALANGLEILGIAWGGPTMLMGFMQFGSGTQSALRRVLWGAAGCSAGLATPGCLNWLVCAARDSNLFS